MKLIEMYTFDDCNAMRKSSRIIYVKQIHEENFNPRVYSGSWPNWCFVEHRLNPFNHLIFQYLFTLSFTPFHRFNIYHFYNFKISPLKLLFCTLVCSVFIAKAIDQSKNDSKSFLIFMTFIMPVLLFWKLY